jgi:hypothetical protein
MHTQTHRHTHIHTMQWKTCVQTRISVHKPNQKAFGAQHTRTWPVAAAKHANGRCCVQSAASQYPSDARICAQLSVLHRRVRRALSAPDQTCTADSASEIVYVCTCMSVCLYQRVYVCLPV